MFHCNAQGQRTHFARTEKSIFFIEENFKLIVSSLTSMVSQKVALITLSFLIVSKICVKPDPVPAWLMRATC